MFNVIGKKNYQTSVSGEDREITSLRSTDNAENSVNLATLSPSRIGISRSASESDIRFYLSDRYQTILNIGTTSSINIIVKSVDHNIAGRIATNKFNLGQQSFLKHLYFVVPI